MIADTKDIISGKVYKGKYYLREFLIVKLKLDDALRLSICRIDIFSGEEGPSLSAIET